MKKLKLIRWLAIVIVLSLIFIPAAPAMAATMITSPTTAAVGETVTVTGAGYTASDSIGIYLSNQAANVGNIINTNVTVYQYLGTYTTTAAGVLSGTFTVPQKLSQGNVTVVAGTYYLYACIFSAVNPDTIQAATTIVIQGSGSVSVSPTAGKVGSTMTITGTNYPASSTISVVFGSTSVTVGTQTTTSTSGAFTSTIVVPDSTAGAQTVSVSAGGTTQTTTFIVEPDMFINPQSGEPGDSVQVIGSGFGRRAIASIYFNSLPMTLTSPTTATTFVTGTDGSFSVTFNVPESITAAGSYAVEADDGTNLATATFTLTVPTQPTPTETATPTTTPTASIDVTPLGGTDIGDAVAVIGTGFTPNSTVAVTFGTASVATGQVNETGSFVTQFQIPAVTSGSYVITATDAAAVSATYSFTMEAIPPTAPVVTGPTAGAVIKTPMTFSWSAITGTGITYELQVATDQQFTAASTLITKDQLTTNSYELTEAQELLLAGQEEPYFWRIRSVDAGMNTGNWTLPNEFYVATPFSLPTWAIITIACVGAILVFFIGYLVGRRTAFYY